MKLIRPDASNCFVCTINISNKWWIFFKHRILCRKCYDKFIQSSKKNS